MKVGKLPRQLNLIQASKGQPWGFDEEVAFGGLHGRGVRPSKPRQREVRVGAKWLHGLKGESKTGGTGSSGEDPTGLLGGCLRSLVGNGVRCFSCICTCRFFIR